MADTYGHDEIHRDADSIRAAVSGYGIGSERLLPALDRLTALGHRVVIAEHHAALEVADLAAGYLASERVAAQAEWRGEDAASEDAVTRIVTDAEYCWGQPRINGTRIPTATIADIHDAGDSIEAIANAYEIRVEAVAAAVYYEHGRRDAALDRTAAIEDAWIAGRYEQRALDAEAHGAVVARLEAVVAAESAWEAAWLAYQRNRGRKSPQIVAEYAGNLDEAERKLFAEADEARALATQPTTEEAS